MTANQAMQPVGFPAEILGRYAASIRYDDLPPEVVAMARSCIQDSVGVCIGGACDPVSLIVTDYLRANGAQGKSSVLDGRQETLNPASAALLNGVFSHASEFDCLRRPGAGVHGAPVVAAALAVAQHLGKGGKDLLAAVVAGIEVMFRIGNATHHSCESRGFHAPGLTGPFGAATAAGHLYGLSAEQMTRALGICGSLCSGLLEFARSGDGSMVKKLHLGRAAESGILAAGLAGRNFTGPASVLDGDFGFLAVFCERGDPERLTANLGSEYEILRLCCKRYPFHITAHAPVEAILRLKELHDIEPAEVQEITIEGSRKMADLHNIAQPSDTGLARYSIPFCAAIALADGPPQMDSFSPEKLANPRLLELARRIRVVPWKVPNEHGSWAANVTIRTGKDSHNLFVEDFPGSPTQPFSEQQRFSKFFSLASPVIGNRAEQIFHRLESLEDEQDVFWIH